MAIKTLLTVAAITALLAPCWVTAKTTERPTTISTEHHADFTTHNDNKTRIITWAVPMVIFFLIVAVGIGMVYVLYRAHTRTLCCMKPKMSYRPQVDDESSDTESGDYREFGRHSPPPSYESAYPSNEDPPDYHDALHDVIVNDSSLPYSTHATAYGSTCTIQENAAPNGVHNDGQTNSITSCAHDSPVSPASAPDQESASGSNSTCSSHPDRCPAYERSDNSASCPNSSPFMSSTDDTSPMATTQVFLVPICPGLETETEEYEADITSACINRSTQHRSWNGGLSPGRSFVRYSLEKTPSSPVATRAETSSGQVEDGVDMVQRQVSMETRSISEDYSAPL